MALFKFNNFQSPLLMNARFPTLSTKSFNKEYMFITPKEAYDSHDWFKELYYKYTLFQKYSDKFLLNIHIISGLNFEENQDQKKFAEYYATYAFGQFFGSNNIDTLYNLLQLKKNNNVDPTLNYDFFNVLDFFLAYALANSNNVRLQRFFETPTSESDLVVKGPGRKRIITSEFKQMLRTKEDFFKYYKMRLIVYTQSMEMLHTRYLALQNAANTQLILQKTDAQTRELKEHYEQLASNTSN